MRGFASGFNSNVCKNGTILQTLSDLLPRKQLATKLSFMTFSSSREKVCYRAHRLSVFGHDRKDPRYVYALTLVDKTRYMTMCPLLDTTTKAVVSAIEHNWIQYFGVMSILVSDQGPQFRGV